MEWIAIVALAFVVGMLFLRLAQLCRDRRELTGRVEFIASRVKDLSDGIIALEKRLDTHAHQIGSIIDMTPGRLESRLAKLEAEAADHAKLRERARRALNRFDAMTKPAKKGARK